MSTNVLSFLRKGATPVKREDRNEEPKPRSIILPTYIWDALDKDAVRCKRSATKQVEAILVRYYDLDASVELNEQALSETAHDVSHKERQKRVA